MLQTTLIWQQKFRGAYPVSRFALSDDGSLAAAIPKPLQARTWNQALLTCDGGVTVNGSFSSQTLVKVEISANAQVVAGMTATDLYTVRSGVKQRFLPDRRAEFRDMALAREGGQLVVCFSDFSGASYATAMAGSDAEPMWVDDVEEHLTAVAISPDGSHAASGAESGCVNLYTASRDEIWRFECALPVGALAVAAGGAFTAYMTLTGSLGLIDGEGSRRWTAELSAQPVALCLTDDGGMCLAACVSSDGAHRLVCLDSSGRSLWDHPVDSAVTGISLAPGGGWAAFSLRSSAVSLLRIQSAAGTPAGATSPQEAAESARSAAAKQDYRGALAILSAALGQHPTQAPLCRQIEDVQERWLDSVRAECRAATEPDALQLCVGKLAVLEREALAPTALSEQIAQLRKELALRLAECAAVSPATADALLLLAVSAEPLNPEWRIRLATVRQEAADAAEAEADAATASGDHAAEVDALNRAQSVVYTEGRAQRLLRAVIARELAAGMQAYDAREYPQAVFQFKKVLAADPGNAEAAKRLQFAERFMEDTADDGIAERFRMLE
ncbi:MAG: hypothetical protein KGJ62_08705 [Armatimonadetes bacterium]|nr:hypothetical protein [Armatimonadota bacterium]MDE2205027.1 hypothetical protein [Armatimonadota bacterium]